jgi:hypothetical protein
VSVSVGAAKLFKQATNCAKHNSITHIYFDTIRTMTEALTIATVLRKRLAVASIIPVTYSIREWILRWTCSSHLLWCSCRCLWRSSRTKVSLLEAALLCSPVLPTLGLVAAATVLALLLAPATAVASYSRLSLLAT